MQGALVVRDDGTSGTVVVDAASGQLVVEFEDGTRGVVTPDALIPQDDGSYLLAEASDDVVARASRPGHRDSRLDAAGGEGRAALRERVAGAQVIGRNAASLSDMIENLFDLSRRATDPSRSSRTCSI